MSHLRFATLSGVGAATGGFSWSYLFSAYGLWGGIFGVWAASVAALIAALAVHQLWTWAKRTRAATPRGGVLRSRA